jgi:uncharacterized NAD-dependent epimerase/dehydratase family protein
MKRYLILAEGYVFDPHYGKTMRGVVRYRRNEIAALVDSEHAGEEYEGLPIVGTVAEALAYEPDTALVGVATSGGRLPPAWQRILRDAVGAGLDLESGMHIFLTDDEELVELARAKGASLTDLRRPPADLTVPSGANLEQDAATVLTVGSDCAIGKMTVSLELDRAARERGLSSVFVPTGQTGIAIAGWGISVDAVVADFVAGAAERLVVEGASRGDLLWVEGQGAVIHPQYSGVTLGLMHGSAPHAYVLCHQAGTTEIEGSPGHPIPPLSELVELHERISLPARPAKVVAVAVNTRRLADAEARNAVREIEAETRLPTDDPVRFGADGLLDAVLAGLPAGVGPATTGTKAA